MDAIQGELELGKQHHLGLNQFRRKNKKDPVPTEKRCYWSVACYDDAWAENSEKKFKKSRSKWK